MWRVHLPSLPSAPWVSEDEALEAARFRRPEDARRALLTRGVTRALLARYAATPPQALAFTRACSNCGAPNHGKPRLVAPAAATPLTFNLSHSGDLLVIALSRGLEVGVDVERVDATFDWEPVARQVFTPEERATLAAAPEPEQRRRFFDAWTRNEAALKLTGHGLAAAAPVTNRAAPAIRPIEVGVGYSCHLATAETPTRVLVEDYPPGRS
ncbi:MAG TPA: 4'-phosphopantetheinyl transferase superfamily protein [Candidatus Thermoplasmatota archaeon]|nr:4'-phosphopantetheinyl transferase superfamily protein [Candidatus Thermoplasmatota archaeon]